MRVVVRSAATIFVLVLAGLCASSALGAARRPVVLHLKFHRLVLPQDEGILAEGRYVFFDYAYRGYVGSPPDPVGTVLDQQTGRRTPVSLPPGCPPQAMIGGPWVAFTCYTQQSGSYEELYSLASGAWRTIRIGEGAAPVAVGRYWIELMTCPGGEHCLETRAFQNIQTGAVRADPTTTQTFTDLDLPGLKANVCRPLHMLREPQDQETANRYQEIQFFGSYGIFHALTTANGTTWNVGDYVQRCGSRVQRPGGGIGNAHLLLLPDLGAGNCQRPIGPEPPCPRAIDGLFLPSGPRFTIPNPQGATRPAYHTGNVALSDRTLFLGTYNDEVCKGLFGPCTIFPIWTATLPSRPPSRLRSR